MWPRALYFLLGVTVAPLVKPVIREILRQGVTGGIIITGEVQKILADARENYQDIVAEAAAVKAAAAKDMRGNNTGTEV
jgi:acyl-CoA synthetase (NDP forming)